MSFSANPSLSPYWGRPTWGVGEETKEINKTRHALQTSASQTLSLGWRARLDDEVVRVYNECSAQDWDGYGGLPISMASAAAARGLLDLLPEGIQPPEITPEPRGTLAFDWVEGPNVFSISILGDEILYAASLGRRQTRGKEPVVDEIPEVILRILQEDFRQK